VTEPLYVLRNFHGVADIERTLAVADTRPSPLWCAEYEQAKALVDAVSRRLFGIGEVDTQVTANPYATREANQSRWEAIEPAMRFGPPVQGPPADVLAGFEELGFDVGDGAGGVLRCLPLFRRQIIAVVECGLGRLPDDDLSEREQDAMERRLRDEAAWFKADTRGRK
jgi:hypothetical protein